jgi:hypothetical protein
LFENGQPAKGNKSTWSVQSQKGVPSAANAHLRLSNETKPLLVSRKGVHDPIRPGIDPPRRLADNWSLESVIFGTLGFNASAAAVGGYTEMRQDMTPEQIREEAVNPWTTSGRIKELYKIAGAARYGMPVPNENGVDELMPTMLVRIGKARLTARQALKPDDPWLEAINGMGLFEDAAKLRKEIDATFAALPESDPRLMGIREAYGDKLRELPAASPAKQEEPEPVQAELVPA